MIVVAVNTKTPIDNTALRLRGNLILGMIAKILAGRSECLPTVIDTVTNEMKAWCFAIEDRKLTENEATYYRYMSYIHTALIEFDLTGELAYLGDIDDAHGMLENFIKNLNNSIYIDTDSSYPEIGDLEPHDFLEEEMIKQGMYKTVLNRRYGKEQENERQKVIQ